MKMRNLAALVAALLMVSACSASDESLIPFNDDAVTTTTVEATATTAAQATTSTSVAPDETSCTTSWARNDADHGNNNRWFTDGVVEIRDADTPDEALDSGFIWLDRAMTDPELLSGAAEIWLKKDVDPSALFDSQGCATPEAEATLVDLQLHFATVGAEPDADPSDALNTGTDADGNVVMASSPGISGDTSAIAIDDVDGNKVFILARCGNPAPEGDKPDLPEGPTDEPEEPETPPSTLAPKDPTKEPSQNDNVDVEDTGAGAGTIEVEADDSVSHGYDEDDVSVEDALDPEDEHTEDILDDGYCQGCENPTAPPIEATPSTTVTTLPPVVTNATDPDDTSGTTIAPTEVTIPDENQDSGASTTVTVPPSSDITCPICG